MFSRSFPVDRTRLLQALVVMSATLVVCASLSCNGSAKSSNANKLIGTWKRMAEGKTELQITFHNDTAYTLLLEKNRMKFSGVYEIADNEIQVVDLYCGTKFPGIYTYSVKRNTLTFEVVKDDNCMREKMWPGLWKRIDRSDPAQI